jgi:hypothetical protein
MAKGVLPIVVWRGEVVVSWEVRRGTGELVSNRGLTKCDPSRGSM